MSECKRRQHRPAEPGHDTLRYVEVDDGRNASGPGHEKEFNMVSVPNVNGGSPEVLVNEPGKLVGFGTGSALSIALQWPPC